MESQEHLVPPSSPSSAGSPSPPSSSGASESSSSGSASSSSNSSQGEEEDRSSRGGIEGEVEEAENLISQTEVGDYELVDLHPPTGSVVQSPSTPDLLFHHRNANRQGAQSPQAVPSRGHNRPQSETLKSPPPPPARYDSAATTFLSHDGRGRRVGPDGAPEFRTAAATLNRYTMQRTRLSQNLLYSSNKFHNQSFVTICPSGERAAAGAAVLSHEECGVSSKGRLASSNPAELKFNGTTVVFTNGGLVNEYASTTTTTACSSLVDGTSTTTASSSLFLHPADGHLHPDDHPLPPLFGDDTSDIRLQEDASALGGVIPGPAGNDAAVDVDVCCRRFVPASFVSKLGSPRSGGLFKSAGGFGLREKVYYGSIFLCMALIVIVCFVVITNRTGGFRNLAGSAASLYNSEKQCELLLDPVNGEVHQTGRHLGDRAIYTCALNWEIVGAEERVCQSNGQWSNQEPFCKKKVYCLDPPLVQHATHNGSPETVTYPLETVLKYTCYPGYLTVGFAHAKCFLYNDTAQWFGPDITCKAIRCSEPEEIANGDVDRKCQTFGCRISYQCRAGYELVGREHRYCQADGSWSPRILPECAPIQCEVPKNPDNGRAVYASVSYNSLISYECTYGYMLIGDSVRRCERNKQWTGTEPHCKEINCGSPGILPNGWLEGTRTTLHAVVTFRCQEGMTFEGPSYRTICQADGRWSHPLPRCYAPCIVPHISHGFVSDRASGSSVPHANTIDVRCLSQFQKTHNATPVCKNGTWSRIPKCIPAKCTELPEAPRNGMVVAPKLDHGMVGKFECRDGYMLKGHNTTQCFFGNWTGMTPWCKEVFCPFPGFVENGKVLLVGAMGLYEYRPYVRKIRNNRQIMFQCDRGFALVGGPTGATCIDGHWSPPQLPRCQEEALSKARFSRSVVANYGDAVISDIPQHPAWTEDYEDVSGGSLPDLEALLDLAPDGEWGDDDEDSDLMSTEAPL